MMSKYSDRRIRMIYKLCILKGILTMIWGEIAFLLGKTTLSAILFISVTTYFCCLALCNNQYLSFARQAYMITFILAISIATSAIGKAGSVEYMLMFSMALPFLLFSYRREKSQVIVYSGASVLLRFLLYFTDFTHFVDIPLNISTLYL